MGKVTSQGLIPLANKYEWASDFRANLEESQFWPLDSKRVYFVP